MIHIAPLLLKVTAGVILACLTTTVIADQPQKPDILFIAIDDMNDWTTLFDKNNPIQTPNLERLAARGTFFNRAYCASPGCNPSRTAIMTGLRPTTSGVYHNGDPWRTIIPDAVSLPEYFANEGGYQTLGAGKIYHHGHTGAEPEGRPSFQEFFKKLPIRGPGRDQNYNGYRKKDNTPLAHPGFDWGVHDQKMIDVDMCEWVEARMQEKQDQPLFLAAGIFNPHLPFYADAATFERYPKSKVMLPPMPAGDMEDVGPVGVRMTDKESFVYDQTSKADPDCPNRCTAWSSVIRQPQTMPTKWWAACSTRSMRPGVPTTLSSFFGPTMAITSVTKNAEWKFTLWEKANRVPFILVAPESASPVPCGAPVSLVDIYPTLVELAGLPPKADNDGASLVPLLADPNAEWTRPALMTEGRGNHAIRTREFRYIRYYDGFEELYQDNDPWNHTNLAAKPEYAEVLAQHRAHLPKTEAPGELAKHLTPDNKARRQPKN